MAFGSHARNKVSRYSLGSRVAFDDGLSYWTQLCVIQVTLKARFEMFQLTSHRSLGTLDFVGNFFDEMSSQPKFKNLALTLVEVRHD